MRSFSKKIAVMLLVLVTVLAMNTAVFAAADTSGTSRYVSVDPSEGLPNGYYSADLYVTLWSDRSQAADKDYSDLLGLSGRAFLMKNETCMMQLEIQGISQLEALYYVKQEDNGKVERGKIGTDWTNFEGGALTNYEELKTTSGDESLNGYFQKLTPAQTDAALDRATFVFSPGSFDETQKLSLVGYTKGDERGK